MMHDLKLRSGQGGSFGLATRIRFPTVGELSPKRCPVDGKDIVQPGSEVIGCGVLQLVESHFSSQVINRKGICHAESREMDNFISPVVEVVNLQCSQDFKCHRCKSGLPYAENVLPIRALNERADEGHQPVLRKHGVVKVQHRSN
nr:hypothetical protein Itr_chr15CG13600 [Ipomoea trifida]